jgi:RNA polymerase sigma-70 factor (family 1)
LTEDHQTYLPNTSYNERELLQKIADGDEKAFRKVYDIYYQKVYKLASYLSREAAWADDIVQEVFMKCWTKRKEMAQVQYFTSYIGTMTRNQVKNRFRRQAVETTAQKIIANQKAYDIQNDPLAYNELQKVLAKALSHLTASQRKIFEASRFEGLKNAEIAQKHQMNEVTVKKHLSDALKTIRAELNGYQGFAQMSAIIYILLK